MSFATEFPGVVNIGTRVPSWHTDELDPVHWGDAEEGEDSGMEAAVYAREDGTFWVESWAVSVGLTTFWTVPDGLTAVRLADYIVRGGL